MPHEKVAAHSLWDQLGEGNLHGGLAYTMDEQAQTSVWTGKIQRQTGTVHGYGCPKCGRVLLYAEPSS